jgi:hypothetical protein
MIIQPMATKFNPSLLFSHDSIWAQHPWHTWEEELLIGFKCRDGDVKEPMRETSLIDCVSAAWFDHTES